MQGMAGILFKFTAVDPVMHEGNKGEHAASTMYGDSSKSAPSFPAARTFTVFSRKPVLPLWILVIRPNHRS